MNQKEIGAFIATCRNEQQLTQRELAERIGVTDRAVSKWENGRGMPDVSLLPMLAQELQVEVSELLQGRRMTKEELIERKGTIEQLIEYHCDQQIEHGKRLNACFKWGMVCMLIALLDQPFPYFRYLFTPQMAEFMKGLLYGGGICLELIGIYDNSHAISFCEQKKQWIQSIRK